MLPTLSPFVVVISATVYCRSLGPRSISIMSGKWKAIGDN